LLLLLLVVLQALSCSCGQQWLMPSLQGASHPRSNTGHALEAGLFAGVAGWVAGFFAGVARLVMVLCAACAAQATHLRPVLLLLQLSLGDSEELMEALLARAGAQLGVAAAAGAAAGAAQLAAAGSEGGCKKESSSSLLSSGSSSSNVGSCSSGLLGMAASHEACGKTTQAA